MARIRETFFLLTDYHKNYTVLRINANEQFHQAGSAVFPKGPCVNGSDPRPSMVLLRGGETFKK